MSGRILVSILSVGILFLAPAHIQSQTVLTIGNKSCDMDGSARTPFTKTQNKRKNRFKIPTDSDINSAITLEAMLAPGSDKTRWRVSDAAEITGFVVKVEGTGLETCNCKISDARFKDTHIDVVLDPNDTAEIKRVVVEVTPRLRRIMLNQGVNWSSSHLNQTIKGKWVKFRGWMFFDEIHADESENTAPGREGNWRATAWELHPVTSIEILPGPPQ